MFPFVDREQMKELNPNAIMVSASRLTTFHQSPKTYHSKYILKEMESTPAMEVGTLIHKAVLEANTFNDVFAVLEPKENFLCTVEDIKSEIVKCGDTPVKGRKDALINQLLSINPHARIWECYVEAMTASGKKLVSAELWKRCQRVVEEVNKHDWLKRVINEGEKELRGTWRYDEETFVNMVIDFYHPTLIAGEPVIIDVKTTASAEPRDCERTVMRNHLLIQAAMYVDGVKQITGKESTFAWAFIESKPPYHVTMIAADSGQIDAGRQLYQSLIQKFKRHFKANYWPGHDNGRVLPLETDDWYFKMVEEQTFSEEGS
jgi:hypothetical protein